MLTEKQFDAYLRNRKYEPPSAGFSERIIGKAVAREYKPGLVGAALDWINDSVLGRRPVYSLLAVLALGLVIGASLPVQTVQTIYAAIDEDEML